MVRKTGKQKCYFCLNNQDPDYKDYSVLARFLNARGGIVGRKKTGVCAKHQRMLSREIKRARHLALLPFLSRPE
ncbi:30S ribosomal protein S18 [bacterium]|nr:30S ribosomal protein S18 [bacterium]